MEVAEFLKSAKALIADKKNWTKGAYARVFATGEQVYVRDGDCFCSMGAVMKVRNEHLDTDINANYKVESQAIRLLQHAAADLSDLLSDDVVRFNDDKDTTHEDVMKMFDLAIEKAGK